MDVLKALRDLKDIFVSDPKPQQEPKYEELAPLDADKHLSFVDAFYKASKYDALKEIIVVFLNRAAALWALQMLQSIVEVFTS